VRWGLWSGYGHGVTDSTTFGRYELRELLAVGGMAEIFLARSRLGGIARTCVIKRILPEYSTSRPFVSMFIDEARITIGLEHEHVVKLLDFGQVDGAYFMAIEYVDGVDLVDILRAAKGLGAGVPPLAAAYIARCMAAGLEAAHTSKDHRGQAMNIVHRDVSPHNVFISWLGAVKIGDFGIASARNKLHTTTVPGTIKGKYGYMSPEQTMASKVDPRADVWATGVVLWEMLVGGRLFATDSPVDTIGRVNEMPIMAPSEQRAGIDPRLDAIVMEALRRPLTMRTQTAGAMAASLDAWIDGRFGAADLEALLPKLGLSRATYHAARVRGRATPSARPAGPPRERTASVDPLDARLRGLHEEFREGQSLWTLVDIGERHAAIGQRPQALAAIRTAAAVFAHRGLLVQAVCAIHALRPLIDKSAFDVELSTLGRLRGHDRLRLVDHMATLEYQDFWRLVKEADPAGLGVEQTEQTLAHDVTPLLGAVNLNDFVRLARLSRIERKPQGSTLVREGERSDALYAVGRGRVVVATSSRDDDDVAGGVKGRVYVAALTEGDFFGEFSFLTQSPRSATVEAASDAILLRIDRTAVDELVSADSAFRQPLLEFYKDRVAELLLAKNPIIGALPQEARRGLIKNAQVLKFLDGEAIVKEGDSADELFFILNGEVEVHREEGGIPIFINKLHEGQFFGEMAALHKKPRTATVWAMGTVEVLAVHREEVERILELAQDVRKLFERAILVRAAESEERVRETTRIFEGV
jgi:serine/threonine protein kinase/CRP-like cAMP-binding protein